MRSWCTDWKTPPSRRPPLKGLPALAGALAGMGSLGLAAALKLLSYEPGPVAPARVVQERPAEPLRPGQRFTVLSWNLQFAGTREHHFFYDGGRAVSVPPEDVERALGAMREVLAEVRPDIALLQEVDRGADRTGRRDQLHPLFTAPGAPWTCWLSAPYHRSIYVPAPPHEPLGRVDTHLAIFSRFALRAGERLDLPRLDEPRIRQAFNLKRALLWAELPVAGEAPLRIGDTHLSAFSRGDGTLHRQVAAVDRWMGRDERFVLAGDFNLLPPGDDPGRLEAEGELYADEQNPMEALIPARREAFEGALLAPESRSYLPFGAAAPDRKIDYVFAGRALTVVDARVIERLDISDHLPLLVTLEAAR